MRAETATASSTLTLTALFLLISLVLSPTGVRAKVWDPTTYTLDNGLQVVVIPNHRAPIVSHMLWYKVGAADEAPGETGLAHFLEHLLFKGTENAPPGEFRNVIVGNGGQENAFTTHDTTAYYQRIPSHMLETMMKYEADRMTNLKLTEEIVNTEREVVREERRTRVDNDPASQLWEVARSVTYLNHPYRRPVIGWDHEIEDLNLDQALAFYRKWYAPNNAVLVVSGDVEPEEVRALAEKYYGVIPARDIPERARVQEPPQNAARSVQLESPLVQQPSISITFLAPSYNRGDSEHAHALEVLRQVIGGGATSRLYRSLVVDQGLAASAMASYGPNRYDMTTFGLSASPRPGVSLDEVEAALQAEVGKFLAEGVTQEEIDSAKKRLKASAVYARDNFGTGGSAFGRALTTGGTVEKVESWPDDIEAVTLEQVNQAGKAVFADESSVTIRLTPKPTT